MTPYSGPAGRFGGTGAIIDDPRWTQLRPLITSLYVDRGMTLAQVQQSLERTHQFTALYVTLWLPTPLMSSA